jgi:MFS family permease
MTSPPAAGATRDGAQTGLIALVVGVVLADSSVVTLGLPDVLRDFDTSVAGVSWVLISFNLVLALVALPAAALVRGRGTAFAWRLGVALFALASLACAVAPSLEALVAARCAQAVGGAAAISAALALLVARRGRVRGAQLWGAAGILGAAVGPAVGGALTQLFSWEAIFYVQVPLVLALAAARPIPAAMVPARDLRAAPPFAVVAALTLVSAALTAALFLLVILLTEGWLRSPLQAAAVVSVMALAALAVAPMSRRLGGGLRPAAAGVMALAGGLTALGLLPGASAGWTIAPQILIGVGLGLALYTLTTRALGGNEALLGRGAWVIAARHAGVVIGLLLLTPLFTADLQQQQLAAQGAGSARLLDARLAPDVKLRLAEALTTRIERSGGRLPDLRPAFREITPPPQGRRAYAQLEADLVDEVRRAATQAFSRSFLLAAALALLALAPIALAGRSIAWGLPLLAATVASAGLVGLNVALGGGSYKPLEVRDPCDPRPWRDARGGDALTEQISLSALDGAACSLRVTREELALAVASADTRTRFLREHRVSDAQLAKALRQGARRAVNDAERAKALTESEASIARGVIGVLPIDTLIEIAGGGKNALEALQSGRGTLDALRGLVGG